ncbi:MAG: cysteine--tRNA ligase [Planctomycetes bacterium]|nr:cysteine--tRNA ligase [Planctomycetota bacterium]
MEAIKIYTTQKREKVSFDPLEPGKVRMYVCGPTVYDRCHIGHARPAVCFDTIRRYLEYAGYIVTFISNITDIDDKIINRANELGIDYAALATRYQDEYERDMSLLGVRSPTIRPKATEHIPEMIALVETLMEKGIAYTTSRGVWFDISKFEGYGKLSGRTTDDDTTEHRVEQDTEKRNKQDFCLWKASKPGEPAWESPWGPGRPGWHIECSAMGGKYCANQLDIHGGGADLTFPHHENEIAQSEAATGQEFARIWMHNGFITIAKEGEDEEKMGKSKGNAFWLHEVFADYPPAALRLWILGTHYRMPLKYAGESLASAASGLDRIYNCLEAVARAVGEKPAGKSGKGGKLSALAEDMDKKFRAAMNDDFNTPQALAVVYDTVGALNTAIKDKAASANISELAAVLTSHLSVLGLPLERPQTGGAEIDKLMELVIKIRETARKEKQYAISDQIRDGLNTLGITLEDRPGGTTWTMR